MGELNSDIRPGIKKSCLKDGRVVMWKRNGARFEIRQILLWLSVIKSCLRWCLSDNLALAVLA